MSGDSFKLSRGQYGEGMDEYDIIYLGYPQYWETMPVQFLPFWRNMISPIKRLSLSTHMRVVYFIEDMQSTVYAFDAEPVKLED